jgi:hypothetical protein
MGMSWFVGGPAVAFEIGRDIFCNIDFICKKNEVTIYQAKISLLMRDSFNHHPDSILHGLKIGKSSGLIWWQDRTDPNKMLNNACRVSINTVPSLPSKSLFIDNILS